MPRVRTDDKPNELSRTVWFRWTSLTLAIAFLSWGAGILLDQKLHQEAAADLFEDAQEASSLKHVSQPKPPRSPSTARLPLAKLEIPRLSVSGYVQEGFDPRTLSIGIGHAPHSAKPGRHGNIVLAAHRDTFFAGLRNIRNGDVVRLRTPEGKTLLYQVSNVLVVHPADVWVMQQTPGQDLLTLITCYPFHFIGSAPDRLVVQAKPLLIQTT